MTPQARNVDENFSSPPEAVIIGAGFGGLEVARALGRAGIKTLVIDRHNHHLFQPLLYQVATAALSATDVAEPIRKILRRHSSVRVMFGEVSQIDTQARELLLTCGQRVPFGRLVVACGAGHSYFGHDDWARWAPGLKTIEDARHIRSRLLLTFERAEREPDPDEQRRLLTIAVIGGGPTGVELAGAIAELSRHTLARDFRRIDPTNTRILLVEAGPRLLSTFSETSSAFATDRLRALGVEIRCGAAVENVGPMSIQMDGESIPVGQVVWAAGIAASPLARALGATDRAGRIPVDPSFAVVGQRDIFALGDVAAQDGGDGRPLPGLAQVARQQGLHLGKGLAALILHGAPIAPFRYSPRGNTAIVGRHAAVFEYGRTKVVGWLAWIAWAVIHVYLLVGFPHRFAVSMQWLWRYLTYERGARLIASEFVEDPQGARSPEAASVPGDSLAASDAVVPDLAGCLRTEQCAGLRKMAPQFV